MPAPLARLLKLRQLLEDASRMELERRAALAARVDQARERERLAMRESREHAVAVISEDGPAGEQARRRAAEWANAESAARREQQLETLARAAEFRVAEAREEFFGRRTERRQLESVLDAEQARLRNEQERRMQRELDDWFGMKQVRRDHRAVRSASES